MQCDNLVGLLVSTALRTESIGPAVACEALAAPMGLGSADAPMWRRALLGTDTGIVQLEDASDDAGLISHDFSYGSSIFLRFPHTQLELSLKETNRVSGPALARARRLIGAGSGVSMAAA